MRIVDVPHLEPGPLARQAAGAERAEPALVRQLGQRVRLIHELAELRAAEEGLDHGAHGTGVHEIVDRHLLRIAVDRHALADETGHAREAHGELVRDKLADRANSPVAEVVDVVRVATALVQLDQVAEDRHEVRRRQHALVFSGQREVEEAIDLSEALVDLVAPHAPQVVPLGVEEKTVERRSSGLQIRRLTRPHQRVDGLESRCLAVGRILGKRVLDQRRLAPRSARENERLPDPERLQLAEPLRVESVTGFRDHLARRRIHDIGGEQRVLAPVPPHRELLVGSAKRDERGAGISVDALEARSLQSGDHFLRQLLPATGEERLGIVEDLELLDPGFGEAAEERVVQRISGDGQARAALRVSYRLCEPHRILELVAL